MTYDRDTNNTEMGVYSRKSIIHDTYEWNIEKNSARDNPKYPNRRTSNLDRA